MNVRMLGQAEDDLAEAFDYYQDARQGLGVEFIEEFRRAVDRILQFPFGWAPLDDVYRRCRLNRFPYGVIYRCDPQANQIIVVAISHLSRRPGYWRGREDR